MSAHGNTARAGGAPGTVEPAADGRTRPARVAAIDVARGTALLAMFVYHFSFDLSFFGLVDWPVVRHPLWRGFAVAIAATFLFVSGASLVLAHGTRIRWRAFTRRLAVLVAAAAAVTVATLVAMPHAPVFFGILHAIALFSVLALPFLRVHPAATAAVAVLVLALPFLYRTATLDGLAFVWLGLGETPPPMVDHEPLFPWFAATLLGVAFARSVDLAALSERLGAPPRHRPGRAVAFMGRHSLIVYLVHQPIFFAMLLPLVWLAPDGAARPDPTAGFRQGCEASCRQGGNDPPFCQRLCGCVVEEARAAGTFERMAGVSADAVPPALADEVARMSRTCAARVRGSDP